MGKKGIVRDKKVHREVIAKVMDYAEENGLTPVGLTFSPMTGAKGNIEYLLEAVKSQDDGKAATERVTDQTIGEVIESAHAELMK